MKLVETPIKGVMVTKTSRISDNRGAFSRLFCEQELKHALADRHIVQINHSRTSRIGAVRGMHFQYAPHAEMKMVRCLKGKVWDVAVDLRQNSSTFLHWHAVELSPDNAEMMVIQEGCAHGFQVLEADSELLYLHTAAYVPSAEGGLRHDDPLLAINWPIGVADLSDRDRLHPLLKDDYCGVEI